MIQDEEFELLVTTPERIEALGFKPQKEILTNHVLPYAEELDDESTRFLAQVKTNLAKAIMLREMKPACGVWSSRLMKYLRIYGLKFGKEDHIALIKLAYELVLIPDLEPCKVHKFATLFLMLTKKKHLVSPEELTLPWRPLYEIGRKIFDKNATTIGLYHYLMPKHTGKEGSGMIDMIRKFLSGNGLDDALNMFGLTGHDENDLPTSLEGSYMSMVKCARPYFELEATKEMLEEFLPQIVPWSTDTHLMGQMTAFLPVGLYPEQAAHGHELWFDQIMVLWDTCYNSPCGMSDLMNLFSGLAKRNPGTVDWAPYVPKMFTRFLHALNLPVNYKDMQYSKNHSLDTKDVASWIVWTINPDGLVLKHLRIYLGAVESYLHSANSGRWSYRLRDLLRKLAREFLNRVRREREKRYKNSWENKTPEAYRLRDEDITEFVNITLEPTLQAVYSRSGSLDISIALQNLATLRPAIVVPPLLERLRTSLTSLTEPHRVTAAMSAVAAVARPMLRGADGDYPEGPTHVVPFLLAVLPGLDPNDIKKTLVTLHFILIFSWMVPYIDCSSAHEYWPDLTEEELLTCESTAQFEDFVLVFLDRLFTIIDSSVMEHVRLDTKESDSVRSKTDAVMETAISSAATAVLMQCSPKIFKEALRKFKSFACDSTYETNVSGSMIGVLLRVFSRINSEATLAAFVPKLCEELNELLSTDEALREENPPRDLSYRLVLLMNAVECDGEELLKYVPMILPVLDRALKLHAKYSLIRACEILGHIFISLSYVDLKELRSSPKNYAEAPEKWLPVRDWGRGCLLKDANFKWHVPNAEEAACAQMLVDRYLKPELARMRQWLGGERAMCRERRLRCFYIINAVLSASTFLPPPDEEPVTLMDSQVPATSLPFTNGVRHAVTLDGRNIRVALTNLLRDVQARMLADKTDDTRGLEMLLQVWERVVVMKGLRAASGLEARLRSYGALERALDGRGGVAGDAAGGAKLRTLIADGARLQDEARFDLVCDAGITPSALQALFALYELSINTYSTVRMLSQARLSWMLSHYAYSYRALVPKLADLLKAGGSGDEWHARHKGALYMMLGPRAGPLTAKQDWEVVRTLWPAILRAPLSEKPSILRLEQAFSETLHRHFPTVNTRLKMPESAIEAAQRLMTEAALSEPAFSEQLAKAEEREAENSDKIEAVYKDLLDDLVDVAETPNIQWRRLELTMQMLTYCPSVQTHYTPRAVNLALQSLLHDDIAVRRTAQRFTHFVLHQRKRPLKKITVDPYEIAGVKKPDKIVPGYREDLEWAMWSEDNEPKTDEEWDRPWLRNPEYGFYTWPDKIEVAAPSTEQLFSSDLTPEQMEAGERHIFEFFNDDAHIEKLVSFLTVEEKKGKDKFSGVRFSMFKSLFSQFGPGITEKFLAHARRCAPDPQEAPQRFAAEVAAAALRAPRYWRRARALPVYEHALDVVSAGLTAVTPETMEDWGTCLASGVVKMDPARGHATLARLLALCAPPPSADQDPDQHTSFVVCARLYALQGALGSLRWQMAPLAVELLRRLDAANFIQHPYQNVRETVGSILMTMFDAELTFGRESYARAPQLAAFLATVRPRLEPLYDEHGDIVIKTAASMAQMQGAGRDSPAASPGPERRAPRPAVPVAVARLAPVPVPDAAQEANESVEAGAEAGAGAGAGARAQLDKQLAARLDAALRLAGDGAAPRARDHARAINLLTTVLRGCMGLIVRGVNGATQTQYTLVGTACALAARGPSVPHDELARAADGFLASVALAHHSPAAFETALATLETVASGRYGRHSRRRNYTQPGHPGGRRGFLASVALAHHSPAAFETALATLETVASGRYGRHSRRRNYTQPGHPGGRRGFLASVALAHHSPAAFETALATLETVASGRYGRHSRRRNYTQPGHPGGRRGFLASVALAHHSPAAFETALATLETVASGRYGRHSRRRNYTQPGHPGGRRGFLASVALAHHSPAAFETALATLETVASGRYGRHSRRRNYTQPGHPGGRRGFLASVALAHHSPAAFETALATLKTVASGRYGRHSRRRNYTQPGHPGGRRGFLASVALAHHSPAAFETALATLETVASGRYGRHSRRRNYTQPGHPGGRRGFLASVALAHHSPAAFETALATLETVASGRYGRHSRRRNYTQPGHPGGRRGFLASVALAHHSPAAFETALATLETVASGRYGRHSRRRNYTQPGHPGGRRGFLASVALAHHSPAAFETALATLETVASGRYGRHSRRRNYTQPGHPGGRRGFLASVALAHHSPAAFETALATLETVASGRYGRHSRRRNYTQPGHPGGRRSFLASVALAHHSPAAFETALATLETVASGRYGRHSRRRNYTQPGHPGGRRGFLASVALAHHSPAAFETALATLETVASGRYGRHSRRRNYTQPGHPGGRRSFLASVALAHHSPAAFETALATLETVANGRSWWARLACLDFAQPLLFYGLPLLCHQPELAERVEAFTLKLMRDPRLEVRQSAAKLLTGLMHCGALPDEERTLRELTRASRAAEPRERHAGVLGLCAYLASRPYSLGPKLGAVLAELARHTHAPDPVPAAIRAALADFRRTHHDDWPRHRDRLSAAELDLLADLTSPPTYCA